MSAERSRLSTPALLDRLLLASPHMIELAAAIERLAKTELSVLVQGGTGTGKELVAEALHRQSLRHDGPFVVCDLSAIGATRIESELFGHRRGAFAGADRDRAGAFALAHGGTLFLDEVGELEPSVQPRLLRALERKQIKPVGSESYVDVDVRIVAATNRDLAEEARQGRFRLDLYHRLAVVALNLPSLRERQLERAVPESGIAPLPRPARTGDAFTTFKDAKNELLHEWERGYLQALLERTAGNVTLAARWSGLARGHLHRLLRKHALTRQ